MVLLIVLVTVVVFVVLDLTLRMILRRRDQARLRTQRQEALEIGLRIEVAEEARSLKRVEVEAPRARILAVDDEPVVLDSLRKILVLDGYSVDTVESGQEALGLIQKRDYDFVFTDLKMPGLDGIEVTKAVRHLRPDIDVVMVTGYATVQSAVDTMKHGALDYVEKPFTEDELTAFVNKCLIRRKDRIEKEQPPRVHLVTASSPEDESERVYNVPAGVFVSRDHVWLRVEMTGQARIGIDDFARKTIGEIDDVGLPEPSRRVSTGQTLFSVKQKGHRFAFPSPVTGTVSAINEELIHHPDRVNVNPYAVGWICRIEPENLSAELDALRIGAGALTWYREEIERIRQLARELTGTGGTDTGGSESKPVESGELWETFSR